jgi:hypothetical protein
MTIFYSLRFETPPTWRARSPYLYPPGTGWPCYTPRYWTLFRRLLRLAGLRWMYSNPSPRGICLAWVWVLCYHRRSVGQTFFVSSTHLGLTTRCLLLSDSCGFVDVGRSLWREEGSAVYHCCGSSPSQSFSGLSPAGLMTTFYSLRFESPPTWRAMSPYLYPPRTEWPGYTPRHWVLFSSPPTTSRACVSTLQI